jgi:putative peptidoglycan lipid II flippase
MASRPSDMTGPGAEAIPSGGPPHDQPGTVGEYLRVLHRKLKSAWHPHSINRGVFSAIVTVGVCTAIVKLSAAGKDLVIAYYFGTSEALDAFLMALLLPTFVTTLIGESLNMTLVPNYISVREQEGPDAAQRLFASAMVGSVALLFGFCILLALLVGVIVPLLASGFTPQTLALTQWLYLALLPALVMSGIATTWGAVLNANRRFTVTALAPGASSLAIMATLAFVGATWGVYALAVGTLLGFLLEWVVLGWALRRQGISLMPRWGGVTPALRRVCRKYAPTVAASLVMGGTLFVSQSMAAMLGPGSVSALSYGGKISTLLMSMGAMVLSTAVLPYFSQLVAVQDWESMRNTLMTYARLSFLVAVPATLLLMYHSKAVIALLFQRGAFTDADTELVSWIQTLSLLQVPLYIVSMLFVRLIISLQKNHLLLIGASLSLAVNVALNYVLMQRMGVAGIALSLSLMHLVLFLFFLAATLRLLGARARESAAVGA